MLKKSLRIRKKEDFERVFRSGSPLFFREIACKIAKNSTDSLRIGFSFSKKHFPLATQRNRLRRQLSAFIEESYGELPKGYDIVFFSLKKGKNIEKEELQSFILNIKRSLKDKK
ncbi:MAG: ribonuclease P protein component [Candidatus Moranbacteria bacterium RIFCSPHIGHO2_01_FULL_55_24]|nr:MAG: ribonuclease P protein component [Candidatus Moranbacteria bacterium RIFCSPHIGHO2_01_FULL_55_24]